jgi:RimJ/RimL family protein N-acetyltransferase
MKKYKTFETERLFLKPTSVEDAEFIFELLNSPNWIKNIGDRNINSINDAKKYIQTKMLPRLTKLGYSVYTLIIKQDNIKIGTCGFYDREGLEGIDIGFALLPEYERKGYAFDSTRKLMNVAFNEFGIKEISAITTEENISSKKLLQKLGFQLNGITKLPNDDDELLLYKTKIDMIADKI